MAGGNTSTENRAARLNASLFGVLSGIGGLVHGIGEALQGNVRPEGIVINSWTVGPIASHMGGEPGMTIVPNLLITGILTILFGLAVIVWSAAFVQRKGGGLVLIGLVIGMLLVGGGFGPIVIGVLAGVAGLRINARRERPSTGVRRVAARLWPWVFGICLSNGVFLVIGSLILVFFFEYHNPDLFVYSFFFATASLLLTILTGAAYDSEKRRSAI